MQSFVWKPGISVSTASLGNSGVIDTLNSFDQLEATDNGWEYQPYDFFLESIFIDQATLNGTRPNSPSGVKPARPLVGRYFKVQFRE